MQDHAELGRAMLAGSGVRAAGHGGGDRLVAPRALRRRRLPVRATPASEIPLVGRIVAVADTFDALTTDRVYRPRGDGRATPSRRCAPSAAGSSTRRSSTRSSTSLDEALEIRERFAPPPASYPAARAGRGRHADDAAGRGQRARDLPEPAAPLGRRGPDRVDPHRRRAPPLPARRPCAGSPPSAACGRACGPSSRPAAPLPRARRAAAPARAPGGGRRGRGDLPRRPAGLVRVRDRRRRTCASGSTRWPTSCASGRYAGALQATDALMRRAHLHAASLLERHAFLERFGQVAVRALVRAGAERDRDRRHAAAVRRAPAGAAGVRRLAARGVSPSSSRPRSSCGLAARAADATAQSASAVPSSGAQDALRDVRLVGARGARLRSATAARQNSSIPPAFADLAGLRRAARANGRGQVVERAPARADAGQMVGERAEHARSRSGARRRCRPGRPVRGRATRRRRAWRRSFPATLTVKRTTLERDGSRDRRRTRGAARATRRSSSTGTACAICCAAAGEVSLRRDSRVASR